MRASYGDRARFRFFRKVLCHHCVTVVLTFPARTARLGPILADLGSRSHPPLIPPLTHSAKLGRQSRENPVQHGIQKVRGSNPLSSTKTPSRTGFFHCV